MGDFFWFYWAQRALRKHKEVGFDRGESILQ